MADITFITNQRTFLAAMQAALPSFVRPEADRSQWDRVVAKYARLMALADADQNFGPFDQANDDWDRAEAQAKACELFARARAAFAELQIAEQVRVDKFLRPMWEAGREVVRTPAPDLAAALFKLELIKEEGMKLDSAFEDGELMGYVTADLDRLASEAL